MRRLLYALAGLVLAVSGSPVAAQGLVSDMDLRGLKAVKVTASPMTVESMDCNLESAGLVRDLRRQLEAEGLRPADTNAALAVVSVLSSRDANAATCNSTVMLGAYKQVSFLDKDVGWLRTGYVVVWQSGVLVTSSAEAHPTQVRDALARLGDAMVKDWRAANTAEAAAGK